MLHPNTIIIYNITATTINIQALKNVPGSKLQLHHNTGLTGLDLLPTILIIWLLGKMFHGIIII